MPHASNARVSHIIHKESRTDFREMEADTTDAEIAQENTSAHHFYCRVNKLPKSRRETVPNADVVFYHFSL